MHYIEEQPNAIPYITSYYKNYWGFCISHNFKKKLLKKYKLNSKFRVIIDSSFNYNGKLNYGEIYIKGKSKKLTTDKRWNDQVSFVKKDHNVKPSWFGLSMLINKKFKKSKRLIFNRLDKYSNTSVIIIVSILLFSKGIDSTDDI